MCGKDSEGDVVESTTASTPTVERMAGGESECAELLNRFNRLSAAVSEYLEALSRLTAKRDAIVGPKCRRRDLAEAIEAAGHVRSSLHSLRLVATETQGGAHV